ncbi:hypothetical protein V6N13_118587 [Hibiscus sabdariffa]|uniref:Uncharacterized protein n=2 Tax=Hibiscus sabdariffa TaxID=183260 RepID=A0ABR2NWC1_9ROSI
MRGITVQDKATWRWRGGACMPSTSTGAFNPHARWQPSTLACMAGSGFGRILSDKATSRWRGGPRSRHQLHRCTARRLESLHRPTRPSQGGELLPAL